MLAGSALRLGAAQNDFWNTKPPSDWTAGDVYQLMNHSPWSIAKYATRPGPRFGPGVSASSRDGSLPGSDAPTLPSRLGPKVVVTWESAPPIRDALKTPLPDDFAGCYVIGVDGMPLGGAPPMSLLGRSTLRSAVKVNWAARPVVVRELDRTSAVYLLGFPRAAAPIIPQGGDVLFTVRFGPWLLEVKFRPRDMVYRGQLAL